MKNIYELKRNDTITINNKDFYVEGGIEFVQNNFFWKEYILIDYDKNICYLNVEKNNSSKKRYSLYKKLEKGLEQGEGLLYNNNDYDILDSGIGIVVDSFGDSGVSSGDNCEYIDYENAKDKNSILSYENWKDGQAEYSIGKYINERDIKNVSFIRVDENLLGEETYSFKELYNLKIGRYLIIENIKYYVNNIVTNRQGSFIWREFLIVDENSSKEFWLSVEEDDGLNVEIHRSITLASLKQHKKAVSLSREGINYKHVESGQGNVKSFHSGDYDHNESFYFEEFISEDGKDIITIETWSDGREASIGRKINYKDIQIVEGEASYKFKSYKTHAMIFMYGIFILIMLGALIGPFMVIATSSVSKQLGKSIYYEKVTDITLSESPRLKGEVYEAIDLEPLEGEADLVILTDGTESIADNTQLITTSSVAKSIIEKDAEGIVNSYIYKEDNKDLVNPEILITTQREDIYIYQSLEEKIYIQVSKNNEKKILTTTIYKAMNPEQAKDFYLSALAYTGNEEYITTVNPNHFNEYRASARVRSVIRRSNSGGGSSFGK